MMLTRFLQIQTVCAWASRSARKVFSSKVAESNIMIEDRPVKKHRVDKVQYEYKLAKEKVNKFHSTIEGLPAEEANKVPLPNLQEWYCVFGMYMYYFNW